MISLRNLVKSYDNVVLDNINIDFECGKIYVLKGISGSGKTTLLNIIGGLDKNFEGEYIFFGKDRKNCSDYDEYIYQKNTNYIFQQSLLISHLNIMDNLLFINYDFQKINKYAKRFKVEKLLKKFPNQLSGGEKQRIAIIRALITDCNLLIVDEATSSLDKNNSLEIAKVICSLKDENKIIIISTHKSIYDDKADEIINIKDGRIEKKLSESSVNKTYYINAIKTNNWFYNIKYAAKRFFKKSNKWSSIFVTSIFLVIVMLILGFKQNFKEEFLRVQSKNLPYHIFTVDIEFKSKLSQNKKIKIYEEYKSVTENLNIFPLLEEKDSIFSNNKYLLHGDFPKNNDEVLVDISYVNENLKSLKNDEVINYSINIFDKKYMISGIITDESEKGADIFYSNPFYIRNSNPTIFMPYSEIKAHTKIDNNTYQIIGAYKEVYEDYQTYDWLVEMEATFPWNNKIEAVYSNLNLFLNIMLIVSGAIIFIAFMFLYNQVNMELHYRNKEFGYLRLFHVSKNQLLSIVLSEYNIRIFISFLFSILFLILICTVIYFFTSMFIFPSIYTLIIIFLSSIIYIFCLVFFPLKKVLKKTILGLIR